MDEEVRVDYRRADIARFTPIVLRQTSTTRLVFIPSLTNSQTDQTKPLLGTFAYQKKSSSGEWEPTNVINLQKLKAGDGVRLELKTSELHLLKEWFDRLYKLYEVNARPPAENAIVPLRTTATPAWMHDPTGERPGSGAATEGDSRLVGLLREAIAEGQESEIAAVMSWCLSQDNPAELVRHLERLNVASVELVNTISGLARLKTALAKWKQNKSHDEEVYWQSTLREDAFVLSQLFSFPVVLFGDQCYVGGKMVDRKGDKLIDFLLTTKLTNSVLLVEIKTPTTKLLGREYRSGLWKVSEELVGAVAQASDYLDRTVMEYTNNRNNARRSSGKEFYEAFQPRCIVIAGCTEELSGDVSKTKGFESYRNNLRHVDVVTFDELFQKTQILIELLEGVDVTKTASESEPVKLPF